MKKYFVLVAFVFLLTACGATAPEGEELLDLSPLPKDTTTENTVNIETENTPTETAETPTTCTTEDLAACESKSAACIQEIEKTGERIASLEESAKSAREGATQGNAAFNSLFVDYFQKVEQKEYAFDSCGTVGTFASAPWFADFKTALEAKNIFLAVQQKTLVATDFFGGCRSDAGKMAFFIGAGAKNQTEFHLVKYDFDNKTVSEATLGKETCTDCPTNFGKRKGAYIELLGDSGTLYRYYFDKNIVLEAADFQ